MAVIIGNGGVGERLKPAVLKTVRPERVSGVRIPPPPPVSLRVSLSGEDFARKPEFGGQINETCVHVSLSLRRTQMGPQFGALFL